VINDEVIAAVAEWVGAVVPAIGARTYDYEPASKPKGLPDCAVTLTTEGILREAPDEFPEMRVQQLGVYVWRLGCSVMVESGVTEDDARAATLAHRAYARALFDALRQDPFLGGRLEDNAHASVWSLEFDYEGPLTEYEDGTLGREMTFTLAVAEPVTMFD
jgi:hypothetical protein